MSTGFLDLAPLDDVLRAFSARWAELRDEITAVDTEWVDHPDRHLTKTGWTVVPVKYFNVWDRIGSSACPVLSELLGAHPQVITAVYMRLAGGITVPEHAGNPIGVARCHLGLIVPPGCWLEVAGDRRTWVERGWLVFDDAQRHKAVNGSDTDRIVLSLDLEHPDVPKPRVAGAVRFLSGVYYRTARRFPAFEVMLGRLSPLTALFNRVVRRSARK